MRRSISASSALCSRAISIISRRIFSRSSSATTAASRRCTSNPAGFPGRRAWTSSSPPCAPCASRSSTSRSRKSRSRRCFCACSRSRGVSTCKFSRSSSCLQKTLLNIEGLGRQLYPELDLWKTAQPILRRWMRERMSPRTLLKQARAQLPDTVEALKQLPQLFNTAVREAAEGRLRWQVQSAEIEGLRRELRATALRRDIALAAAMLWLSGFIWLAAAVHVSLARLAAARSLPPGSCSGSARRARDGAVHENSHREPDELSRAQCTAQLDHAGVVRAASRSPRARSASLFSPAHSPATAQWYAGLAKPPWMPPSRWFGPVWIALYCLMGTAAWLVSRERYHERRSAALLAYFLQLAPECRLGAALFRRAEHRRRAVQHRRAVARPRPGPFANSRRCARRGLDARALSCLGEFRDGVEFQHMAAQSMTRNP